MNTYILIIAMSLYHPLGSNVQISEFQTKEACEVALFEARKFWRTIDNESKCIDVKVYLEKQKAKAKLKELGDD